MCLKNTQDTVLCNLPLGFLILFEGGQNNDMCSLLASSVQSFKHAFLPQGHFSSMPSPRGLALPGADAENIPGLDLAVVP